MINTILLGDCLDIIPTLPPVDLIYLDPPWFTQQDWGMFTDKWDDMDAYLKFIKDRVMECRRVMKDTGSIYLHCDYRASHRLRTVLEEVFGVENFVNEIIWNYKPWFVTRRGCVSSHQTIFWYAKDKNNFKHKPVFVPCEKETFWEKAVERGWFVYQYNQIGVFDDMKFQEEVKKSVYVPYLKCNLSEVPTEKVFHYTMIDGWPARHIGDVWTDIKKLFSQDYEGLSERYPTQKPIRLLKRIIELSTDVGDVVLDPMCGSGTTCVAAKLLGRDYVGVDVSEEACRIPERGWKKRQLMLGRGSVDRGDRMTKSGYCTNPECPAFRKVQWYGDGKCKECREKLQECVIKW